MRELIDCNEQYTAIDRLNIIVGDLILRKIDWASFTSPDDKINKPFLDLMIELGYIQFVNFPTHICNNILDIVLADDEQIIYHVASDLQLGCSDHVTVKFTVAVSGDNTNESANAGFYKWNEADYNALETYFDCFDWQSLICFHPSAMSMWTAFTAVLRHAIDLFVPFCASRSNTARRPKFCKRHTAEMLQLRSKKLQLWHKLKTRPYDSVIRTEYRLCVSKWRDITRKQILQTEERIIESNSLGAFYRHVNKRVTHRADIGVIIADNGDVLVDDRQKADAFNTYYASVGVIDNNVTPHIARVLELTVGIENIYISESDVLFAISRLKNNLSSGPDGFPPAFFLRLKHSLAAPLCALFTQLLSVAAVPDEWKTAIITPVFKKGDAASVSNYRPISLTCVLSKIMERIISYKLYQYFKAQNVLSAAQHGFMRGRSTCINLLESLNDWTLYLVFTI